MGHTLIMGRKTYQSLANKLPGRKIIVVTSQKNFYNENCSVVHSLTQAIELAAKTDEMPLVCGGAEIYKQALPFVQKMYITEINKEFAGDTFFPEFNENEWKEIENRKFDNLTFRILKRIKH